MITVLAGCGAQLGDPSGGQNNGVDAGGSGSNNGGTDSGTPNPDGSTALCANNRKLYLNFDGQPLTRGAPSDAVQNRASWMGNTSATVPPYKQGDANRTLYIQQIVDGTKARLAGKPIVVVTTRPAAGPYVMVVLGGDQDIVGTIYSFATNQHDCGDTVKSDIGWISDAPSVTYVPDLVVGTVGWGLGLNGTADPTGCMCGWANGCSSAAGACTLSPSIATTALSSPETPCPNQNPQNEVAAFSTGFCQ